MKLNCFLAELQMLADHIDASDVEVAVEGWDDNPYDGDCIEGLRMVSDIDMVQHKVTPVLFIIRGQGRK